jgi:type IV pilus assembly protein PilO
LVAVLLGGALVLPQWQQWQQGQARLAALRASETQLPLLRRQLETQLEQQATAEHQQELLVRLIAGSGNLATVLAQMDRVAAQAGVQLDLYEPQQAPPETPAKASGGGAGSAKPAPPPPDPLAVEGLQRQTVLLAAKGRFPQVLDFLRRIERLNLLVVQSDLQLALEDPKSDAPATPAAPAASPAPPASQSGQPAQPSGPTDPAPARGAGKVLLKLNVSLYGRGQRPPTTPKGGLAAPG